MVRCYFVMLIDQPSRSSVTAVPMTMVSDKGSETVRMIEFQKILRCAAGAKRSGTSLNFTDLFDTFRHDAAPEISEDEFRSWVQVQSKHNTPIEGFWLWFREGEGHNIRKVILDGAHNFNSDDRLHVCVLSARQRGAKWTCSHAHRDVFNWLWPPLLQERLDEYCKYWNNHTVRHQKEKDLPSGTSPNHIWTCPTDMRPTARDCRVNVHRDMIHELRAEIGGEEGRRQAYQFVTPEFQAVADAAYADLGYPRITLMSAWTVFLAIVDVLQSR